MVVSFLLFLTFGGLLVWSVLTFGPVLTVPMIAAFIGMAFGTLFLIRALLRRRPAWIVIDGSNVLYWQDEDPSLQSVRIVLDVLTAAGLRPVVWFDANVGYLVSDRYLGPRPLARALGLSPRQVQVAPKGTPADPLLIEGAGTLKARIVTNDRFRDWREHYPMLRNPDVLVRGRIRDGELQLDLTG